MSILSVICHFLQILICLCYLCSCISSGEIQVKIQNNSSNLVLFSPVSIIFCTWFLALKSGACTAVALEPDGYWILEYSAESWETVFLLLLTIILVIPVFIAIGTCVGNVPIVVGSGFFALTIALLLSVYLLFIGFWMTFDYVRFSTNPWVENIFLCVLLAAATNLFYRITEMTVTALDKGTFPLINEFRSMYVRNEERQPLIRSEGANNTRTNQQPQASAENNNLDFGESPRLRM
eukprot:TRINITY_DN6782_c0_g1_i4.p1 TRINITY_DN6782_c0_g1~~TRINITY_DN6782_c0_g1_i4.p1  ORF type:complete len:236 (+),score=29.57 TRINITY_DN6782_c0_g1_i4:224-931(+)